MKVLALGAAMIGVALGGVAEAAPGPYPATRARPLFSPTRRPPPPVVQPLAAAPALDPAPPPTFGLSGVVLGPGTGVALLTRAGGADATRVTLGSYIEGWRLTEVRSRSVVLTRDDRSVTLALPDATR